MLTFWLIAAVLTLAALLFALWPLLFGGNAAEAESAQVDRAELNVEIYREHLAELQRQQEQGELNSGQFEQAKLELEKSLARDLATNAETETASQKQGGPWVSTAVLAISLPLLAFGGYWYSGGLERLEKSNQPASHAGANQAGNLEEMVATLAQRLENQPDNLEGWTMLARSYRVMERFDQAAQVYARLMERVEQPDADLLADYAETLGLAQGGQLGERAEALLAQSLELDPGQPKALWLSGMMAAQREDYATTVRYWQTLLQQFPEDSEQAATIRQQLDEVRQMAGEPLDLDLDVATAGEDTPETEAGKPGELSTPDNDSAEAAPKITAQVKLDQALQDKIQGNEVVFVYARAAEGPRMPLAIVTRPVADLPLTVTLDDAMSMMPNMKISNFPEVIITARVSAQQSAMPQSGDLLGESEPVPGQGERSVNLTIDQVIP